MPPAGHELSCSALSDWTSDPAVVELRERIAQTDRAILERVNERIAIVEELRRYKEEHGYPFLDPAREDWLIAHLAEQNAGPLSEDGLRELFTTVITVVKREVNGGGSVA
jgi:chorismate mutase